MCRESYVKIQGHLEQVVAEHGGIWATTRQGLKDLLLEEFPELQGKGALEHPLVRLSCCGIGSGLLNDECPEVLMLFSLKRDGSLEELRRDVEEAGLSEDVCIALMEAGVDVPVPA